MLDISLAEFNDCDDLVALEECCFESETLSRLRFLYHIQNRNCYLLIARVDGTAAGYGMLLFHSRRSQGRIYSICTAPEFRKRGIGSELLAEMEDIAFHKGLGVYLEVREENEPAQQLYRSRGYTVTGRKNEYYSDGGNALVMSLKHRAERTAR